MKNECNDTKESPFPIHLIIDNQMPFVKHNYFLWIQTCTVSSVCWICAQLGTGKEDTLKKVGNYHVLKQLLSTGKRHSNDIRMALTNKSLGA